MLSYLLGNMVPQFQKMHCNMWYAASKSAPVILASGDHHPQHIRAGMCDQQDTTEVLMYWNIKDTATLPRCLLDHVLWRKPATVLRTLKQPYSEASQHKELRPSTNSRHQLASHMREPHPWETEPLNKTTVPANILTTTSLEVITTTTQTSYF